MILCSETFKDFTYVSDLRKPISSSKQAHAMLPR